MMVMSADPHIDPDDFWVFAYASLMWRPGFAFADVAPARLPGHVRDMCFLSIHYRGTAESPGLVCGLMPVTGEACVGRAYRLAPQDIATAVAKLDERELITNIYIPRHLEVELKGGRKIVARVYVADTTHRQFVGGWSDACKAAAIVSGAGSEGRSLDYLANLADHLGQLEIEDPHIGRLLKAAQDLDTGRR